MHSKFLPILSEDKKLQKKQSSVRLGESNLFQQDLQQANNQLPAELQKQQVESEKQAREDLEKQLLDAQKNFINETQIKLQAENKKLWNENMELQKELSVLKSQAKVEIESLNDKVLSYEAYIRKMRQDFDIQIQTLQNENKLLNEQINQYKQKVQATEIPDTVKQWMKLQLQ